MQVSGLNKAGKQTKLDPVRKATDGIIQTQ